MSTSTPPLPPAWTLHAPAHWRHIDLISDLHLSADTPATFAAWSRYLRDTAADAVLMLGDLFEVWAGDDTRHEGFEAQCVAVMREAGRRRTLGFMAGNRDFLVGEAMLADCGVMRLPDPTLLDAFGERVLLTHGDALCLDDTEYLRFRAMVRDPAWQTKFLAQPMLARQQYARDVRRESEARKQAKSAPGDWADVDTPAALACLRAADAHVMIHGHTHRPATHELQPGFARHVLSDWELDHPPFRAEVMRLSADGIARLSLEQALASC